jgi:hypothetical protein
MSVHTVTPSFLHSTTFECVYDICKAQKLITVVTLMTYDCHNSYIMIPVFNKPKGHGFDSQ